MSFVNTSTEIKALSNTPFLPRNHQILFKKFRFRNAVHWYGEE